MLQGTRKLMFWTRVLANLMLMLLMMLMSTSITAQQTEKPLPPLKISAGEWPPFLGEHLPDNGTAAVLIRELFANAGYRVEFHFLPWARAYHDTAAGRYDATAIWMFAENRLSDYLYSDAVLEEKFVLFHLKQRPLAWKTLADLKNLQLGGGLGYSYGPAFDQALARGELTVTRVNSTEQNFRRLLAGRIDAFGEEIQVGYHVLQNMPKELAAQITHHPTPLLRNQSFLLFPKQSAASERLNKLFNQQLAKVKKSGRYPQFFQQPSGSESFVNRTLLTNDSDPEVNN
jgi:polar amino acid transport system substrate-binding protein